MNEPDILYPAIFVFSMLLIGLLLTIWEFSRIQKKAATPAKQPETRAGSKQPGESNDRLRKASGF